MTTLPAGVLRGADNMNPENTIGGEPPWRDKAGIAAHFGVSVRHVTNLQRRRVLPYVKLGRNVRFDVRACEEAAKAMEIRAASSASNLRWQ